MRYYDRIEDTKLLKMTKEELLKIIRERERQLDLINANLHGANFYIRMIEDEQ